LINDFSFEEVYFSQIRLFFLGNMKKKVVGFWLFCIVFVKKRRKQRKQVFRTRMNCVRNKPLKP